MNMRELIAAECRLKKVRSKLSSAELLGDKDQKGRVVVRGHVLPMIEPDENDEVGDPCHGLQEEG
jgi:hypothetical protein